MSLKKLGKQFTKYGGVAAGSALIDWLCFTVMGFLGSGYLAAQIVARIAGGLFSFVLNKNWSFDQRGGHIVTKGRRFLILYVFSYCLSLTLLITLVEGLSLNPFIAKAISDVACFVVNFLVMQSYVFNSRPGFSAFIEERWKSLRKRAKRNPA
jgi:putative flippase GtrA